VRYADDIVIVIHAREVAITLDICELWNAASGMARNDVKTEGMWIGSLRHRTTPWARTNPLQSPGNSCYASSPVPGARITWLPPGSALKVLGVMVGYTVDTQGIWDAIAAAMLTQFRLWQLTRLGYLARVLVCKVMVWSKAFFVAAYIPPPPSTMDTLCAATQYFVQHGALPAGTTANTAPALLRVRPLYSDGSTHRPKTEGGLSTWDPRVHLQALTAKWVVLLLEPQREEAPDDLIVRWTCIGRHYVSAYMAMQQDGERGAYALIDGPLRRPAAHGDILPAFWRTVLCAWHGVRAAAQVAAPDNAAEVACMPLWANMLILSGTTRPPPGWM